MPRLMTAVEDTVWSMPSPSANRSSHYKMREATGALEKGSAEGEKVVESIGDKNVIIEEVETVGKEGTAKEMISGGRIEKCIDDASETLGRRQEMPEELRASIDRQEIAPLPWEESLVSEEEMNHDASAIPLPAENTEPFRTSSFQEEWKGNFTGGSAEGKCSGTSLKKACEVDGRTCIAHSGEEIVSYADASATSRTGAIPESVGREEICLQSSKCLTVKISCGVATVCAVHTPDTVLQLVEELDHVINQIEEVADLFSGSDQDEPKRKRCNDKEGPRGCWVAFRSYFAQQQPPLCICFTRITPSIPFFGAFHNPLEMSFGSPERARYDVLKDRCFSRLYRGCATGRWTMKAVLVLSEEEDNSHASHLASSNAPTSAMAYDVGMELILACELALPQRSFLQSFRCLVLQNNSQEINETYSIIMKEGRMGEGVGGECHDRPPLAAVRRFLETGKGFPSAFPISMAIPSGFSSEFVNISRSAGGLFPSPSTIRHLSKIYTVADCLIKFPFLFSSFSPRSHDGWWKIEGDCESSNDLKSKRSSSEYSFLWRYRSLRRVWSPVFSKIHEWMNHWGFEKAKDTILRWWVRRRVSQLLTLGNKSPSLGTKSKGVDLSGFTTCASHRRIIESETISKWLLGHQTLKIVARAEQHPHTGGIWRAWHQHVWTSLFENSELADPNAFRCRDGVLHAFNKQEGLTFPSRNPIPDTKDISGTSHCLSSARDGGVPCEGYFTCFPSYQFIILKALKKLQMEHIKWRKGMNEGEENTTTEKGRFIFFRDGECWSSKWTDEISRSTGPSASLECEKRRVRELGSSSAEEERVVVMDCRCSVRPAQQDLCSTYCYGDAMHSSNHFAEYLPSLLSSLPSSTSSSASNTVSTTCQGSPRLPRGVLIGALPRIQPLLPCFSEVVFLFPLLYFPLTGCTACGSPVTVHQLQVFSRTKYMGNPPLVKGQQMVVAAPTEDRTSNENAPPAGTLGGTFKDVFENIGLREDQVFPYRTALEVLTYLQMHPNAASAPYSAIKTRFHWSNRDEFTLRLCVIPVSTGVAERLLTALWMEAFRLMTCCSCTATAVEVAGVLYLSLRRGPLALLDLYGVEAAMSFLHAITDQKDRLLHPNTLGYAQSGGDAGNAPPVPPGIIAFKIALMNMWKERGNAGHCCSFPLSPLSRNSVPAIEENGGIDGEDESHLRKVSHTSFISPIREDVVRRYLRPALSSADIADCLLSALANVIAEIISGGHVSSVEALHLLSSASLGMDESSGGLVHVLSKRLRTPSRIPNASPYRVSAPRNEMYEEKDLVENMRERYLQGVSTIWPHPLLVEMAQADQPLEEWIDKYLRDRCKSKNK